MVETKPDLAVEMFKLLLRHEPLMMTCDPRACATVTFKLADLLGSILASVKVKRSQREYEAVFRMLMTRIDETAKATHLEAYRLAAGEGMSTQ